MQRRLCLIAASYCMVFLRLESAQWTSVEEGSSALSERPLLTVKKLSYDSFGEFQNKIKNTISPDALLNCTIREYDFPDFTDAKIAIDTANVFIVSRSIFLEALGAKWLEKVTKKTNLTGIVHEQSKYQGEKPFVLVLPDTLNTLFSHLDKPSITESSLYIKAQKLVILHHELSKVLLKYSNAFKFYSKSNTAKDKAFIVYDRKAHQQTQGWMNQGIKWLSKKISLNTSRPLAVTEAEWKTFQLYASELFPAPEIKTFEKIKTTGVIPFFKKKVTGNNVKIEPMLEDEKKNKALNGTHAHVFDLGRAHFESPQKIQKDQEFVIDAKTVYVVEKDGAFDDPKSLGFDHHPVKPINEDLNKQNSIPNYNTVILAIGQSEYANQTFFIKASNLFFEAKPNEEGHSFKDSLLANITGFKLMGTEGLNSPEIFDLDMQKEGMEGWTPLIKKDEWKQEGTVPEFGDPENSNNQSSVKNPVTDADKSHDDSEKWTEHTIDYTPVPLVPTDHNKKPVNAKKTDLKQFFTISDETVQRHQQLVTEQKVEHKKGLERLTQSTQTPNQSPVPPLNNSSLISNISTVFWNIVTTATEGFWGILKWLGGVA